MYGAGSGIELFNWHRLERDALFHLLLFFVYLHVTVKIRTLHYPDSFANIENRILACKCYRYDNWNTNWHIPFSVTAKSKKLLAAFWCVFFSLTCNLGLICILIFFFCRWQAQTSTSWTRGQRTASLLSSSALVQLSFCWSPPGTAQFVSLMSGETPCEWNTSTQLQFLTVLFMYASSFCLLPHCLVRAYDFVTHG